MVQAMRTINMGNIFSMVSPEIKKRLGTGTLISIAVILGIYGLLRLFDIPTSIQTTFRGIPVDVSYWTILIVVIFWFDGNLYIREHQNGESNLSYAMASALVAGIVIVSVCLHELSHGIVATFFGNPIDHAGITGWGAFVAPTNGLHAMSPLGQICVSLAGVAMNYLIAILATIVVLLFGESLFENSVQYVAVINVKLGRFNLFPIIFLDGGKALEGFLRLILGDITISWWMNIIAIVVVLFLYHVYRAFVPKFEKVIVHL